MDQHVFSVLPLCASFCGNDASVLKIKWNISLMTNGYYYGARKAVNNSDLIAKSRRWKSRKRAPERSLKRESSKFNRCWYGFGFGLARRFFPRRPMRCKSLKPASLLRALFGPAVFGEVFGLWICVYVCVINLLSCLNVFVWACVWMCVIVSSIEKSCLIYKNDVRTKYVSSIKKSYLIEMRMWIFDVCATTLHYPICVCFIISISYSLNVLCCVYVCAFSSAIPTLPYSTCVGG